MSRFLLDTNILSALVRPVPPAPLVTWMRKQIASSLYISSVTVAEIQRGILEMDPGAKRRQLEEWFSGSEGPLALFAGRILGFDAAAGLAWARLMAAGRATGRPRSGFDMLIAAIAEVSGCVVVTTNERHFVGLSHLNPAGDVP